jgi:glycosyltransferase involved in cell wall biosynthesis
MAYGVPVVATAHAGIPEAVIQGQTGFLVREHDLDAMASSVVHLARHSDVRYRLGSRAWQIAAAKYTWERERRQLRELMNV